ncbi:uncharacterized protein KY384_000270 [Bacidia gigantensis]|uniref:uncharacterized protein n=1 Tax=Bacidia gigantensis TaxID=2732470 RepID=UPI001D0521DA|nr:uncharacterized protein KY384_000270 [Bacidia gigantensis]KAG8526277.1 hypothetical protein KY384_000270 [Bacidia gigantensis]
MVVKHTVHQIGTTHQRDRTIVALAAHLGEPARLHLTADDTYQRLTEEDPEALPTQGEMRLATGARDLLYEGAFHPEEKGVMNVSGRHPHGVEDTRDLQFVPGLPHLSDEIRRPVSEDHGLHLQDGERFLREAGLKESRIHRRGTLDRSQFKSPLPPPRENRYTARPQGAALRPRSPLPSKTFSPAPRSPPRDIASHRSPIRKDAKELPASNHTKYPEASRPMQSPAMSRASEPRPASSRQSETPSSSVRDPPTGPASAKPISISAHNRPGSASILSAPTRPRGGPSALRTESREYTYGLPSHRGGRPPPTAPYHNSHYPYESRGSPSDRVPNGPRSSHGGAPPHVPPFRSNNSSSTTYPRTQRFSTTNHLASIPPIIPGGSLLPSADPAAARKISQLEDDAERLRKQIDDKQKEKRAGLRDWDVRERESRREGLRSELAEAQLESFSGEIIGGQAF